MPVLKFYFKDVVAPNSTHGELTETDPGDLDTANSGWFIGAQTGYAGLVWNTTQSPTLTATPLPNGPPGLTDCFRTAVGANSDGSGRYTGTFAAGTWTPILNIVADAQAGATVKAEFRVWRSSDVRGQGNPVEISSGIVEGSQVSVTSVASPSTGSFAAGSVTLNGEFIFVQVAIRSTVTGAAGTDASLHTGSSAVGVTLTTPNFTPSPVVVLAASPLVTPSAPVAPTFQIGQALMLAMQPAAAPAAAGPLPIDLRGDRGRNPAGTTAATHRGDLSGVDRSAWPATAKPAPFISPRGNRSTQLPAPLAHRGDRATPGATALHVSKAFPLLLSHAVVAPPPAPQIGSPPTSDGPVSVVTPTSGASTGTLAVTLADFVSAAAGAVLIQGAATDTLADVSSAAAGAVSIHGALSATLDPVTSSATGAVAVHGALASTLGDATASSAGAVAVHGAAADTLADVTAAATGTVANTGQAADTLGAVSSSAAGGVAVHGACSSALDPAGSSAAGAVLVKGISTDTLGDVTLSAQGILASDSHGALNVTLDPIAASSAGAVAVQAAANAQFDDVSVAATGATFNRIVQSLAVVAAPASEADIALALSPSASASLAITVAPSVSIDLEPSAAPTASADLSVGTSPVIAIDVEPST